MVYVKKYPPVKDVIGRYKLTSSRCEHRLNRFQTAVAIQHTATYKHWLEDYEKVTVHD
jgi:hypothetical protein